jgi:hypothetical protein
MLRVLFGALWLATVSCRPSAPPGVAPGAVYTVVLVAEGKPDLTPEMARDRAPLSDTGYAQIHITEVRGDSAFGFHAGPSIHFWPTFRGLDSSVVVTRFQRRWHLVWDSGSTDSGLTMDGAVAGSQVTGTWATRTSFVVHGTFRLETGT